MSNNRIKILPELVINQIAAGEVIERPASILKELLENSIDANSSMIRIYLNNGGIDGIKVVDNGIGIHPDDIPLVFKQHATSKISNISDLDLINSLGFRGEALASIAAISVVNISSSQLEPTGTIIEVKDIFHNLPVRKKFLRSSNTEFNYIQEMFKRIALSNFNIGFMLYNNNKLVKSIPAIINANNFNNIDNYDIDFNIEINAKINNKVNNEINDKIKDEVNSTVNAKINSEINAKMHTDLEIEKDLELKERRISKLLGDKFIDNAFFFNTRANDLQLYGWISKVYAVSSSCIQYVYLNNRVVKDKLLNAAVKQAMQELSLSFAYCLYFNLNPMFVDVNVHPTKQEVRFSDPKVIYAFMHESIIDAFSEFKSKKSILDNEEYINNKKKYSEYKENKDINFQQPSVYSETASKYNSLSTDLDVTDLDNDLHNNLRQDLSNVSLKIFPIFNNKYVLFIDQISHSHELLLLNVPKGLLWLINNSLEQRDKLIEYKLIIPQRVKLDFEINMNFQIIQDLLAEFKFDIMQIHQDILLIKSVPEYFYVFEIQVDYVRFFTELLRLLISVNFSFNMPNFNKDVKKVDKFIKLLTSCIEFNDLTVYSHKDLMKLIMILFKKQFVFNKLNQNVFE